MKRLVFLLMFAFLAVTTFSFAEWDQDVSQAEAAAKLQTYKNVMKDPLLKDLRKRINQDPSNKALMDNYLIRLPMSPMEMFQIRMESKVREYIIPKETFALHQRWLG